MFKSWNEVKIREIAKGVSIRVITGEKAQMVLFEIEPHSEIPEHSHPHEQMGTVIEGKILLRIGNEERVLSAGDAYVIPSNTPHSAKTFNEKVLVLDIFSPPREEYREEG